MESLPSWAQKRPSQPKKNLDSYLTKQTTTNIRKNMKVIEQTAENNSSGRTLVNTCRACYRKVLAQLQKTKEAILAEFRQTLGGDDSMLHLAVNEAEALAWQT